MNYISVKPLKKDPRKRGDESCWAEKWGWVGGKEAAVGVLGRGRWPGTRSWHGEGSRGQCMLGSGGEVAGSLKEEQRDLGSPQTCDLSQGVGFHEYSTNECV